MSNVTINRKSATIELTKKFEKAAARYGSDEYNTLQSVRSDYPNYRVVVRATKKSSDNHKGLTYSFMERYISNHDTDGSIMKEFKELRGTTEEAMELEIGSEYYGRIKKWFIKTYPELETIMARRESLVA